MACLQIYPELSHLPTFLRVHSNSKEVSYLSWQNTYPSSKTTCHMKLKFFLWTTPCKTSHICRCAFNILKSTVDIHLPFITNSINLSIERGCFLEELKLAEVSPILKKKDDLDKENYRPVSVLPHVSKVFERIMYHQTNDYMKDKLSKQLTGFIKNLSTQHCLSCRSDIWTKVLDKAGYICAIFMDLSKAFDTLNHDLLIAKSGAYGFETDALRYIKSY